MAIANFFINSVKVAGKWLQLSRENVIGTYIIFKPMIIDLLNISRFRITIALFKYLCYSIVFGVPGTNESILSILMASH